MASISLTFKPWPPLSVRFDDRAIRQYLEDVGKQSVKAFRSGMRSSGRKSSAGQYPAIQTGRLAGICLLRNAKVPKSAVLTTVPTLMVAFQVPKWASVPSG